MKAGLLEEVKSLLNMGLTENDISMKAIGYKELIGYLRNEYDLSEAVRAYKEEHQKLCQTADDMVQALRQHTMV